MLYEDVKAYIAENIYHSAPFDKADEAKQKKAVNNATYILYMLYKNYNPDKNPLPVEAVAYQAIFIMLKDANVQKADMGVTSMSIEGMAQSFASAYDRTVAPEVKRILKRKVGSYSLNYSETQRSVYYD